MCQGENLDMGLAVVLPSQQPPFGRDESVLIDPSGKIVSIYQKAHPVAGEENLRLVAGNGRFLSLLARMDAWRRSFVRIGTFWHHQPGRTGQC